MTIKQGPGSTYRLQFHKDFTLEKAFNIIDYLKELGITDIYSSPLLFAKPSSTHGYDIINHSKINPEIGSQDLFIKFSETLKKNGMNLILDIVPNHMSIGHPENRWWSDILQNGFKSLYNDYFDIDWHPPRTLLEEKVLLPLLTEPYGKSLENQQIILEYQNGEFFLKVNGFPLKTNFQSWLKILEPLLSEVSQLYATDNDIYQELLDIINSIKQERDKEIKQRISVFFEKSPRILELLNQQLTTINGIQGNTQSFDLLDAFLKVQFYRLAFWRVANYEINYRRFFDITDYAAIRMEKKEVFEKSHKFIKTLCNKGYLKGLRIDHIDGLWDPKGYLENLNQYIQQPEKLYIIVEKILIQNEKLPEDWECSGTVGYDFLNEVNQLFVYHPNYKKIQKIYQNFTKNLIKLTDLFFICKKFILENVLYSELRTLNRFLVQISEKSRKSQDFTEEGLKKALIEVIAFFPIYRTYMNPSNHLIHSDDLKHITLAIEKAKKKNAMSNSEIFHFIEKVLLNKLEEDEFELVQNFVMRFQQLTGPVMAKSIEDTAFYRYFPLASLNEVGNDLTLSKNTIKSFHEKSLKRLEFWPQSLLATSTHDTKRSEDVRARINFLSEIPLEWSKALREWSKINKRFKGKKNDDEIPDKNEEYLLYQTLIGSWPLVPMTSEEHQIFIKRIQDCMEKSIKEAKIHSSWINPQADYDESVNSFIQNILANEESNLFLVKFKEFVLKIIPYGMLNSLSQTILKLTCPGIPDIYQGNEVWNFSLVDPDNRRPIDFENLKNIPEAIKTQSFDSLCKNPVNGLIKWHVTQKLLQLRNSAPIIFQQGHYLPLKVKGPLAESVIAYLRFNDDKFVLVVTMRFFSQFMKNFTDFAEMNLLKSTMIELPTELTTKNFKNIFSEKTFQLNDSLFALSDILNQVPFAVLLHSNG